MASASELNVVVREASVLRGEGTPFLLATVVAVRGSSYRRAGARMIVADDRWVAGCVSGGCLEGDVLRRGPHRIRHGAPVVVTYDSTADDDEGPGIGLGCNGVVDLMLERIDTRTRVDPLRFAEECARAEGPGVLLTVFRSDDPAAPVGARLALRGAIDTSLPEGPLRDACERLARLRAASRGMDASVHELDGATVLAETFEPPPRLLVCGTAHDALPVVLLARSLGWRVTVAAGHPGVATRERFAAADEWLAGPAHVLRGATGRSTRSFAVVMAHDYARDRDCLAELLESSVEYIGVLGPRQRTDRMLAEIARSGRPVSEAMLARLHAPVGLDVGAETPQEIALAIVSEVQAELTHASGRRLRERSGPIHAGSSTSRRGRVLGAVLAAGGSRRLGRPKQLEPFRDRPLVRHVTDEVARSSCDAWAVVLGANALRVREVLRGSSATLLDNPCWTEGIASSLREAVAWAVREDAAALVVVLADQPLLVAAHVDRLIEAWRDGAPAAGSRYDGTVGVPAVFDTSLFGPLAALEGDRGAARLLRDDANVVGIDWEAGALDVDTETALSALSVAATQ